MFCSQKPEKALVEGPTTAKKRTTTIEHSESRLLTPAKSPAGVQRTQKAIRSVPEICKYFEEANQKVRIKRPCPSSNSNQDLVTKLRPLVIRNGIDGECYPAAYYPNKPAGPNLVKVHQQHLSISETLHSMSGLTNFWNTSVSH